MGKKETKKYSDIPVQQTNASEPSGIYGDINAMKVQLVNRIMRIDEPEEFCIGVCERTHCTKR